DVNDVDFIRHVEQRAVDPLAEEHVRERVDGDDAEATALKARGHRSAGFGGIARGADDGDRGRALEDLVRASRHDPSKPIEAANIPAPRFHATAGGRLIDSNKLRPSAGTSRVFKRPRTSAWRSARARTSARRPRGSRGGTSSLHARS